MTKTKQTYEAKDIVSLDSLEYIRIRPDHVVGNTSELGHYIIFKEIIDNALDEAAAGYASEIKVWLSDDLKSVKVEDNGRGIPLEKNEKRGISTLAMVFAYSQTGGKFNNNIYANSIGTHGIGATATNALSEKFKVQSYRGKQTGIAEFKKGVLTTKDAVITPITKKKTGTVVEFTPDYQDIFKTVSAYDYGQVRARLAEAANLLKDVKISLEFNGKTEVLPHVGIAGFLTSKKGLSVFDAAFNTKNKDEDAVAEISVALAFGSGERHAIVNLSKNADGGVHMEGVESALYDLLQQRCKSKCPSKTILDGFDIAVYLKHPLPTFSSQTKEKLINKGLSKEVYEAVTPGLKSWIRKNASDVDAFLEKAIAEYERMLEAKEVKKALKDIKQTKRNSRGVLPDKLFEADCKATKRELYLVEGDSAAGSAVKGRDASFQEILPLKGKIINSLKSSDSEVLANEEVAAIFAAIGGGIGEKFNLANIRVSKVILLSDSDHDGYHITCLLLSLFAKYMPGLLEGGYVYTVDAPLFKGSLPGSKKRWFGHSIEDIKQKSGKEFKKLDITRLKGHGEANPDEVAEYAMESTRKLIKLTWSKEDMKELINIMGEDIEGRKELLGIQ